MVKQSRIAIRNYRTSDFEIWNLDKKTKEQTIKLSNDTNHQNFSSEHILASDLETSFKRLAWLTSSGDLVIRNIETNRRNTIRLDKTSKAKQSRDMRKNALDTGSIGWESDGSLTVRSLGRFKWTQTESEVHGILTPIATTTSGNGVSKSTLQFSGVYGTKADLPTLKWSDEKAKLSKSSKTTGNGQVKTDTPADTWLQRFDTKLVGLSKRNPVHALTSNANRIGTPQSTAENVGVLSVSPNGAYCIEAKLPTQRSEQDMNERFVTSLADPMQSMSLGLQPMTGRTQLIWHAQGKYFMTLETKSTRSGPSSDFRLFDTESFQWKPLPYTKLPKGDMLKIIAYEDQFLLVTKSTSSSSIQLWKFTPTTLQAEELKSTNILLAGLNGSSILATKKSFSSPE